MLAALGGTLPETLVTLFAALGGLGGVSTGTALGSPALLSTLAFACVACASLASEGRARGRGFATVAGWDAECAGRVRANLRWFAALFGLAALVAAAPLDGAARAAAPAFLLAWLAFCLRTWDRDERTPRPTRRLYLSRAPLPGPAPVLVQTTLASLGLAIGAEGMAALLERASEAWGVSQLVVSLWLAPFATELPELATAVLWSWRGRLDLAMLNVSGALVMSATLPVVASLALSPWRLEPDAGLALAVSFFGAAAAGFAAQPRLRRGLLVALGGVYAAYVMLLHG